jgi:iduronate 2-sulfatase
MKYTIPAFTALMLALPTAMHAAETRKASTKPNVLFIAVDDLRTSLGCYGDTLVKSPNIDRLAAQGVRFNRAYCHQAVCGPSRASILTGRLPDNTRVWHNRNLFRDTHPDLVTLPQLFKNNGYHAQGLGKVFSGDEREEDPQSWTVPTVLRGEGWKN